MKKNKKNPFEGLSIKQVDAAYSTFARGNGQVAAKDWMEDLEAEADKHVDAYTKETKVKEKDKK